MTENPFASASTARFEKLRADVRRKTLTRLAVSSLRNAGCGRYVKFRELLQDDFMASLETRYERERNSVAAEWKS